MWEHTIQLLCCTIYNIILEFWNHKLCNSPNQYQFKKTLMRNFFMKSFRFSQIARVVRLKEAKGAIQWSKGDPAVEQREPNSEVKWSKGDPAVKQRGPYSEAKGSLQWSKGVPAVKRERPCSETKRGPAMKLRETCYEAKGALSKE